MLRGDGVAGSRGYPSMLHHLVVSSPQMQGKLSSETIKLLELANGDVMK